MGQLSFSDIELGQSRKPSRVMVKLDKINAIVDWDKVVKEIKPIDKTSRKTGGAPHRDLKVKIKMLFLQHPYNLSDPELEDQVNDRLSFQHFSGIGYTKTVPDFTTIWRFKEALVEQKLMDRLFNLIPSFLEEKNLLPKKGPVWRPLLSRVPQSPLAKSAAGNLKKSPQARSIPMRAPHRKGAKNILVTKGT